MPVKAIIGFFDILGYKNLVATKINDVKFIKEFDDFMYKITVELLEKFRNKVLTNKQINEVYGQKVVNSIKVRFIYDNIIFSLPFSDITFDSGEFDQKTTISNCIETFFNLMAGISINFISKTGLVFRGGISVGSHYEFERENYLFVFSEAHNKAVGLEQKANYARILLGDNLQLYLEEMGFSLKNYFYKDEDDNKYCFDIYSKLHTLSEKQRVLEDIKKGLSLNMEHNRHSEEKLNKLIYFAKYHNRKVSRDGLNCPDSVINIGSFQ